MLSVLLPYNKTRSINKSTIGFCHSEFFREINSTKFFRENDFTEIHNNETNHGESVFKNGLFFRVLAHSACGGNFEDFSFFLFFSSSCYNFSSHLGPGVGSTSSNNNLWESTKNWHKNPKYILHKMRGAGGIIKERKKNRNNYITEAARTLLYEDSCHGGKNKKKFGIFILCRGKKVFFVFFLLKLQNVQKITLIPHWLFCIVVVFFLKKE